MEEDGHDTIREVDGVASAQVVVVTAARLEAGTLDQRRGAGGVVTAIRQPGGRLGAAIWSADAIA